MGGSPKKLVGCVRLTSQNLTLFKTKICDFLLLYKTIYYLTFMYLAYIREYLLQVKMHN